MPESRRRRIYGLAVIWYSGMKWIKAKGSGITSVLDGLFAVYIHSHWIRTQTQWLAAVWPLRRHFSRYIRHVWLARAVTFFVEPLLSAETACALVNPLNYVTRCCKETERHGRRPCTVSDSLIIAAEILTLTDVAEQVWLLTEITVKRGVMSYSQSCVVQFSRI